MTRTFCLAVVLGLASPVAAQRLIAVDNSTRALSELDKTSGIRTQLGTVGANAGTPGALAFDPTTNTMFLASTSTDSLYTLDIATGVATLVGPFGNPALTMHGLEYDSVTGTLWGASTPDGGLYRIHRSTGAATLIGPTGLTGIVNLCHDSQANVLYATDANTDRLYRIDRATGTATGVGLLNGPTTANGLAYDRNRNVLFLVCSATDRLFSVDRATGATTAIGSLGSTNITGLAYVPGAGRIQRNAFGCGATTITTIGTPRRGGAITTHLGGLTTGSVPLIGYGLVPLVVPVCTCVGGHEWLAPVFASSHTFAIPNNPAYAGMTLVTQGAELYAAGGCPSPPVTLTDAMVITIG